MDRFDLPPGNGRGQPPAGSGHDPADWAPTLARTVAHLAAQLTMTQIRLRALATTLAEQAAVDPGAVRAQSRAIAAAETGTYLRENLGEALTDLIDIDSLEADIVAFFAE